MQTRLWSASAAVDTANWQGNKAENDLAEAFLFSSKGVVLIGVMIV